MQPEELLEIFNLYGRYSQLYNRGDVEGWVALFVPDAVFRMEPRSETGEWAAPNELRGTSELRAHCLMRQEQYQGGVRQYTANIVVNIDGDVATGHADMLIVDCRTGVPTIRVTGTLDDELVKYAGTWRIKTRVARPDL